MSDTTNPQPSGTILDASEPKGSTLLATEMLELEPPECLRLLAATGVGRIAISVAEWDHSVIRPVNYVFDERSQAVLIHSAVGSKLQTNRASGLEPWAPGHKGHWVRIRANTVSGRRIALAPDKAPGYSA
jgi:Pyridoxamine 5'-phosphate oxidase